MELTKAIDKLTAPAAKPVAKEIAKKIAEVPAPEPALPKQAFVGCPCFVKGCLGRYSILTTEGSGPTRRRNHICRTCNHRPD